MKPPQFDPSSVPSSVRERSDSSQTGNQETDANKANKSGGPTDSVIDIVRVDIYVSAHCSICSYSYEVADQIREEFPEVAVRIIDMHETEEAVPEAVFATPTYLLNDKVWSLGNPSEEDMRTRLSQALVQSGSE